MTKWSKQTNEEMKTIQTVIAKCIHKASTQQTNQIVTVEYAALGHKLFDINILLRIVCSVHTNNNWESPSVQLSPVQIHSFHLCPLIAVSFSDMLKKSADKTLHYWCHFPWLASVMMAIITTAEPTYGMKWCTGTLISIDICWVTELGWQASKELLAHPLSSRRTENSWKKNQKKKHGVISHPEFVIHSDCAIELQCFLCVPDNFYVLDCGGSSQEIFLSVFQCLTSMPLSHAGVSMHCYP